MSRRRVPNVRGRWKPAPAATSLQAMQRELSTAPAIDHARVQAVREALQAGTYKINAEAIADGMLGLEGQLGG